MDGIGGWVIQFVQPWRSKAYSRSIIFVCTTLHGLGSMPNTGEPTWANHTFVTDFIWIFVWNVGIAIPIQQYSLTTVPFWKLGFNWNTLNFTFYMWFLSLFKCLWSHLTIIWYKNLTLQGCWHWRLQSKPENCWLCRPLCWNQHEFGKGDHELQMKWLGSVIVNTVLLIFYVGLSPLLARIPVANEGNLEGSPTKNTTIRVVTVTGQGDNPNYMWWVPSRELTYPPKMAFWRWFSFSQGGIC